MSEFRLFRPAGTAAAPAQKTGAKPTHWRRVAVILTGCSLLFLLVTAFHAISVFVWTMRGHEVTSVVFDDLRALVPLGRQVAGYVAALLVVHTALALLCVALAWLTERAVPGAAAKRTAISTIWLLALVTWVLVADATWYPWSLIGEYYHDLLIRPVGLPITPLMLLTALLAAIVSVLLCIASARALSAGRGLWSRAPVPAALVPALAIIAGLLVWSSPWGSIRTATGIGADKPHVILIGIDSLRADQLRAIGGEVQVPHLDEAVAEGLLFRDTITPLARTFPAWVSILSGRHPRATGASFNLTPREQIHAAPTLADHFRRAGYRTVFATDEVRFSNIDESYGFDRAITPVIGASDFLIATINDLPLPNVLANTLLGRWLFPHTHANRAAAITYRPETFLDQLNNGLEFDQPTLLAVHLTAAHWPYTWANSPRLPADMKLVDRQRTQYLQSIDLADRQAGALLAMLQERRALESAIVVFLSDHGEALCRPADTLLGEGLDPALAERISVVRCGHGTSVLSPPQYQVLLSIRGYGPWAQRIPAGESALPASLEDIAPTLVELLDIDAADSFDGLSLAAALDETVPAQAGQRIEQRFRFVETGLKVPWLLAGSEDVARLAIESAAYYSINPDSGWVEIRRELMPEFMKWKEHAVIHGAWIMAAQPAPEGTTRYVLANRDSGVLRIVDRAPEPGGDPIAYALWQALHARFPGELHEPAG